MIIANLISLNAYCNRRKNQVTVLRVSLTPSRINIRHIKLTCTRTKETRTLWAHKIKSKLTTNARVSKTVYKANARAFKRKTKCASKELAVVNVFNSKHISWEIHYSITSLEIFIHSPIKICIKTFSIHHLKILTLIICNHSSQSRFYVIAKTPNVWSPIANVFKMGNFVRKNAAVNLVKTKSTAKKDMRHFRQ